MNGLDPAFWRRLAAGLLVSALLGSPAAFAQKKTQKPATKAESERGEGEGDNVRRREEWFYKQRRFPLGHIPAGARQKALDRKEEMRQAQREARANRGAAPAEGASAAASGSAAAVPLAPSTTMWTHVGPMPALSAGTGVGFVSGRLSAIAVDPTNANTVFVGGAQGGVWKSMDGGTTWATTFDGNKSLAIGAIAIDPSNTNTIYVGTGEQNFSGDSYYGAGIYKSTNGGTSWGQTLNLISGCSTQIGASCSVPSSFIAPAAPFNENVGGVHISSIVVHPENPMKIFAGVQIFLNVGGGAFSGLYCSDDAGDHWTQVIGGAVGTDIQISPANIGGVGTVAYAALGSLNGDTHQGDTVGQNGVYKSTNANAACTAQTWTLESKAPVPTGINAGLIRIGLAPSDATAMTVYAAVSIPFTQANSSDDLLGVFKTSNGGTSWTMTTQPPDFCISQCSYDLVVKVHPNNANTVFLGGSRLRVGGVPSWMLASTDGGATWNQISEDSSGNVIHVDQHGLAFGLSAGTATKMYVGNDGGIWSTALPAPGSAITSNTIAWNNLNMGLEMIQFYPGLSIHPASNQITYAGSQDNGTEKMDTTGGPPNPLEWTELNPCGDGGYTSIDPSTPSTVYVACQLIDIEKSLDNGSTFSEVDTNGINGGDRSEFIAPLELDPAHPQTLYFGTFRVWQTTNGGTSWSAISPDLSSGPATGDDITSLSISPQNSNVVYAGMFGNGMNGTIVQRTTQANLGTGATWTKIDGGTLPPRTITQVAGDPNNQDVVFVTISGFSGFIDSLGHVFKCNAVAATCADISGGLPNIPVNAIVVDPIDPTSSTIYIGTDIGVFGTTTGGLTWTVDYPAAPNGLPNVAVLGMAIHPASRILRVVTHGRSAWDLQLTGLAAYAISSISPTTAAAGTPGPLLLTVTGTGFSATSTVLFNNVIHLPTTQTATQLTVNLTTADLANPATVNVQVSDPAQPGTGLTNSVPFTVTTAAPTVTASAPPSTPVNMAVTLTIAGTNFISSSVVRINNNGGTVSDTLTPLPANITSTSITVMVPVTAQSVQNAGTYFVSVFNPPPGGGDSSQGNQVPPNFTVTTNAPAPANDNFAKANNCVVNGTCDTTNNVNATINTGGVTDPSPSCVQGSPGLAGSGNANSIWYKFTATGPGTITADTIGSLDDTILSAFTGGPPAAFAEVACNDDIIPGVIRTSQITFAAIQGTTYFFMVSSFPGNGGLINFDLSANLQPPTDFTATANPTSASVSRGRSASTALSIAPMGGALYPGPVTFTCMKVSLPSEATCIFTPNSVAQAAGATMVNLSISTVEPSAAPPLARRMLGIRPMGWLLWSLAALLSLGLFAVPRAARHLRHALTVGLLLVLGGLAVSCGGGGGSSPPPVINPGTPLGTFTVMVQLQSGNVMHNVPFTLTVTP